MTISDTNNLAGNMGHILPEGTKTLKLGKMELHHFRDRVWFYDYRGLKKTLDPDLGGVLLRTIEEGSKPPSLTQVHAGTRKNHNLEGREAFSFKPPLNITIG